MGKMYTLQPDESINDHVKESMSIINHIVELSIGCMRDLANPHEGTFVDMTYDKFMRSLEHIRESIQMLDELCDELEDDKDEVRREYEEKVIQFFNRFMNSDLADEYKERSNQLEQRCSKLVIDRDNVIEHWTKYCEELLQKHREELAAKDREIYESKLERDKLSDSVTYWKNLAKTLALYGIHATKETYGYYLEVCKNEYVDTDIVHMYPKITVNNPCNFCGNCKYFTTHPNDVATCNNKHADPFIVDPDDASCSHFKPTYDTRVVIGKPEFPCCDHCNHDDCDDCTLCPF